MSTKDTLKQIEELLRKDGFARLEAHATDHSQTLSGEKGEEKVVVHITDQMEAPGGAGISQKAVPTMHIRPTFPVAEAFAVSVGGQVSHAGHSDNLGLTHATDNVCKVC